MSVSGNIPLENAEEIIERFGGIRPMANKIDVAVTTIQGWKKRGVIPANRRGNILTAAQELDIDLSDIIDGLSPPANQSENKPEDRQAVAFPSHAEETPDGNVETDEEDESDDGEAEEDETSAEESETVEEVEEEQEQEQVGAESAASSDEPEQESKGDSKNLSNAEFTAKLKASRQGDNTENFTQIAIDSEKRAITKSAVVTLLVVLLVLGAMVKMLLPKMEQLDSHGQRISSLEGDMSDVKQEQSMFKGLVPRDWSKQLEDLKKQVAEAKDAAAPALESMRQASEDMIGEKNMNAIEDHVVKLESYVSEITQSTSISALMARLNDMSESVVGQKILDQSMLDLSGIMGSMNGNEDEDQVNSLLDRARAQSAALGQTFENVPPEDLQAAAMLLALTQMRSTLGRDSEPFDQDLGLLMRLVGEENVELRASLERLAPHAQNGILSSNGLTNEFSGLAIDVVESSLKGEDVSLLEKAQARMNNLLAIEKDGELISGTETQATVNKAQNQLEQGNIAEALKILQNNLNASELKPLEGWIEKAQGYIGSQQAMKMIENLINTNTGSGYLGGANLLQEESRTNNRSRY